VASFKAVRARLPTKAIPNFNRGAGHLLAFPANALEVCFPSQLITSFVILTDVEHPDWRLLGISTQQPRGGQNALVQTNIGLYADVRPAVVALMSTTGLLVLPPVLPLIAGLAQPQRSTACVLVPATNNARKLELVYLADMSGKCCAGSATVQALGG